LVVEQVADEAAAIEPGARRAATVAVTGPDARPAAPQQAVDPRLVTLLQQIGLAPRMQFGLKIRQLDVAPLQGGLLRAGGHGGSRRAGAAGKQRDGKKHDGGETTWHGVHDGKNDGRDYA